MSGGHGVYIDRGATGRKTHIQRCRFLGCKSSIVCCGQGEVIIHTCHSAHHQEFGFVLRNNDRLRITQSSSYCNRYGCCVMVEEGRTPDTDHKVHNLLHLSAQEVVVCRAERTGFRVSGAETCEISNCWAYECGAHGMKIDTCSTWRSVTNVADSVLQSIRGNGVWVTNRVQVKARNVCSIRNKASGFKADIPGTQLSVYLCQSHRNQCSYVRSPSAVLQILNYECDKSRSTWAAT